MVLFYYWSLNSYIGRLSKKTSKNCFKAMDILLFRLFLKEKYLMKISRLLVLFTVLLSSGGFISAQEVSITKETFKVFGNCEMCKTTIEKAANAVEGVKSAKWNPVNRKIKVKFYSDKTSVDEIQLAIAAAGYDSEHHKASDEVYKNLHHCCQYDRDLK